MARQLVESLVGDFEPTEFENEYREQLRQMLEAKLQGKEIAKPEPVAPAPVVDLMDALRASIAQAQKDKRPSKDEAPARRRRARAKA